MAQIEQRLRERGLRLPPPLTLPPDMALLPVENEGEMLIAP